MQTKWDGERRVERLIYANMLQLIVAKWNWKMKVVATIVAGV